MRFNLKRERKKDQWKWRKITGKMGLLVQLIKLPIERVIEMNLIPTPLSGGVHFFFWKNKMLQNVSWHPQLITQHLTLFYCTVPVIKINCLHINFCGFSARSTRHFPDGPAENWHGPNVQLMSDYLYFLLWSPWSLVNHWNCLTECPTHQSEFSASQLYI